MSYVRQLRVFVSSPGDVNAERAVTLEVLDRLPYDAFLRGRIAIDIVAWDKPGADTPMRATMTPQAAINEGLLKPSQCDIVLVYFWSRMGTPLPHPEYQKSDGSVYMSGTEWEYLDAMQAAHSNGKPEILLYRCRETPNLQPDTPGYEARYEQYQRVKQFFDGFRDAESGALRAGVNEYRAPEDLRLVLEGHLRGVIKRILDREENSSVNNMVDIPASNSSLPVIEEPPIWGGSPFPGLSRFREKDAPIFFGRGREIDALTKRVAQARFVAVVGSSGSGKSSLVGAGLIPRLRANAITTENVGSKDWIIVGFIVPGNWHHILIETFRLLLVS